MAYQIRITGQLDARWADWFEGLTITRDGGDTLITGPVVDQAALHGLLRRVRDLGLPLVSVATLERRAAETPSPSSPQPPHALRSVRSHTSPIERGPGEAQGR